MCCDGCFNSKIPDSTEEVFIFKPTSKTWINGLSSSYEIKYFNELKPFIAERELNDIIQRINDDLYSFWPCPTCFGIGYACAICTLGISFLCPLVCINDAKSNMLGNIERYNRTHFNPKGLNMKYRSMCCTSYLELSILNKGRLLSDVDNKVSHNQLQSS